MGESISFAIGSVGNDDDDSENVVKKLSLRPSKLYRVYLDFIYVQK